MAEPITADPARIGHVDHRNYRRHDDCAEGAVQSARNRLSQNSSTPQSAACLTVSEQFGAGLVAGGSGSGDQDFSGGITGAGEEIVGGGLSEGLFGSGGLSGALGLGSLFGSGGLFGSLFKGIGSLFSFEHGGIVPSAQGGWMVPSTSLAMLHTNEMVLPADISQGLQGVIAGGGSAPSVNATFAVSAMDSQSVATFFKNNGATLVAALNQAMRNGSALRTAS